MLLSYSYSVELHRSSHRRCSKKTGVPQHFAKLTRKHLPQSLFLNKTAGPRTATLIKKRLWHRCFPVNFIKTLRAPILKNVCERLHLVPGWRITYKLSSRDWQFLTCLLYINISTVGYSSFFHLPFFYTYLFWFWPIQT